MFCPSCPPLPVARLLRSAAMLASIVVLTAPLRAQTQGRWSITYTYSGTSIALMNGSGSTQQWPAGGPASVPTVTFGAGAAVTVSMFGTITATLRWVDQNGTSIFDPPPPSEVFILQTAGANWTYGGEDVVANVTNEGISAGLPNGVITATTGPLRHSGTTVSGAIWSKRNTPASRSSAAECRPTVSSRWRRYPQAP